MRISNVKAIGTNFKKENVFLATMVYSDEYKKEILMRDLGKEISESNTFEELVKVTSNEQYDVLYKSENGYIRFTEHGQDIFAGDNSDGKGIVKNLVSIWKYYPLIGVKEAVIDDKHLVIMVHDSIPLFWYSKDCKNGLI